MIPLSLRLCRTFFVGQCKVSDISLSCNLFDGFLAVTDPSFFYFSNLLARLCRRHSVQTHVRPFVVVEVYGGFDGSFHPVDAEKFHILEQFVFDGIVYSLGHSVVLRIPSFSHADLDAEALQATGVFVAGVLHATVRMMENTIPDIMVVLICR